MNLKKLLAAALAVCVMGGTAPMQISSLPMTTANAADYVEGTTGALTYKKYSDHVTISKCDFYVEGAINIPAAIDGLPVTQIDAESFRKCYYVTSVSIPDSVTYIGSHAFGACSALESVRVNAPVGTNAFSDCTALKTVTLTSNCTELATSAFSNCKALTAISIPSGITEIPSYCFTSCESLESVTLPDTVKSIGSYAFSACSKLGSINIPSGVTTLESCSFSECSSLTSVTLPSTVTSVGMRSFINCTSLTSATVYGSLANYTFQGCTALSSVKIMDKNATIADKAMGNDFSGTIYGYSGSTAQTYAESKGYRFALLDDAPKDPDPPVSTTTTTTVTTTTKTTTTAELLTIYSVRILDQADYQPVSGVVISYDPQGSGNLQNYTSTSQMLYFTSSSRSIPVTVLSVPSGYQLVGGPTFTMTSSSYDLLIYVKKAEGTTVPTTSTTTRTTTTTTTTRPVTTTSATTSTTTSTTAAQQTTTTTARSMVNYSVSVYVKTLPQKTVYNYGEQLDLTGGVYDVYVTAKYSDGTTAYADLFNQSMATNGAVLPTIEGMNVITEITSPGFSPLTPGNYPIVITAYLGEKTATGTFDVTVNPQEIITTTPTTSTTTSTTTTTTTRTTSTTTVTTKGNADKTLSSVDLTVTIADLPSKTSYDLYQGLDLTGGTVDLSVIAAYSDGSTQRYDMPGIKMSDIGYGRQFSVAENINVSMDVGMNNFHSWEKGTYSIPINASCNGKSASASFTATVGTPAGNTTTTTRTTSTTTSTTTTMTTTTVTKPIDPVNKYDLGDVDRDGTTDSTDASAILQEYAFIQTDGRGTFNAEQKALADVDSDTMIDATDASTILAYYAFVMSGGKSTMREYVKTH